MALSEDFKLYGIVDLKMQMMVGDDEPDTTVAYDGTWIDIPGVKALGEDPDISTAELTGDEETLDVSRTFNKYKLTFENALIPLAVLAKINGGTVTTSGTGDTEKLLYEFDGVTPETYFKLAALSKDGRTRLTYYKVSGTLKFSMKEKDYATCSFDGEAIKTKGTVGSKRKCRDIERFATATSIASVAQVETATVAGTITTAGNATVIITATGMTGTPKTKSVAVALADSAAVVAQKIRESLAADSAVTALFAVSGYGTSVVLTKLVASANDSTLNISIDNGTCVGLTTTLTSTNTTAGVVSL